MTEFNSRASSTELINLLRAELVFEVDPSIASGRDDHIIVHDGKSTTITNRGDLMESAVFVMRRLLREHSEQKATIAKLSGALAEATAKCEFLAARAHHMMPPGAGLGNPHAGLVPMSGGRASMSPTTPGGAYPMLTRDNSVAGGMLQRQGIGMNIPMNNNGTPHPIFLGNNNPRTATATSENSTAGVRMPNHHGIGFSHMPMNPALLGNNTAARQRALGNPLFSASALTRGHVLPHGVSAANFLQQGGRLNGDMTGGMTRQNPQHLSGLAAQTQNIYGFPSNNNASIADFAPSSVDINVESPDPGITISLDEQQQHLILVGPQAGETDEYIDQDVKQEKKKRKE